MAHDLELMERHVEALYTHDAAGRLLRVREPDGGAAPRFFLGRTAQETVRRYRHDVDDALRLALEEASAAAARVSDATAAAKSAVLELERYAALLARSAPVQRMEAGPAFVIPERLLTPYGTPNDSVVLVTGENTALLYPLLPAWVPDVHHSPPLMAFVANGQAAAVCGSVRITPRAHEAGVDTAPAFRGRGYAGFVVAAWSRAVRSLGAEPLYSTSWQNTASLAVARKLGLTAFGNDLHIT